MNGHDRPKGLHVDARYPEQLRHAANHLTTPPGLRLILLECAGAVEMLMGALEGAKTDADDGEAVVMIRMRAEGGPSTISIATGAGIDPADPAIILAAQEALAAVQAVTATKQ